MPTSGNTVPVCALCRPPHPGWGKLGQWGMECWGWDLALPTLAPLSHSHSTSPQQVQVICRGSLACTIPATPCRAHPRLLHQHGQSHWHVPVEPPGDGEKKEKKKKSFNPSATHELLPFCAYFQSLYFSILKGAEINVTLQQVTVNKATSVDGHMHKFSPLIFQVFRSDLGKSVSRSSSCHRR